MAQRARGNAVGDLLTAIERALNWYVLPESVEFAFKFRDPQEEIERANTARAYAQTATALRDILTVDERRALVAAQIPAVREVLLDAAGALRLYDADEPPREVVADDRK
jgi:hypothetical protein